MGVCEKGHTSTGTKFCPECGSKMVAAVSPSPIQGWCSDCGCKSAANFCPECGKKKGTPPNKSLNFCEKCGFESPAKFCPGCGTQKVTGGAATPASPRPSATPRASPPPAATPNSISIPIQAPAGGGVDKKQVLCAACGQLITGRVLLAVDDTWHPACFTCVHCLKPQEGCPFYVQDDNVYCQKDHDELFALKCYGCKAIIDGAYLRVPTLGQIFHPDCLVCSTCRCALKSRPFFCDDNSDEILCQKDYEDRKTTTRCDHCREYITGAVVKADNKQYHNKCYLLLNPLTVEEVNRRKSIKQKEIEADEVPDEKEEEEEEKVSLSVAPPLEAPKPVVAAAKPVVKAEEPRPVIKASPAEEKKTPVASNISSPSAASTARTSASTPAPAAASASAPAPAAASASNVTSSSSPTASASSLNATKAEPTPAATSSPSAAVKPAKPAHSAATSQIVHNNAAKTPALPAAESPVVSGTKASAEEDQENEEDTQGSKPNGLSASPSAASDVGASFSCSPTASSKTETKPQQMPPGRDTVDGRDAMGSLSAPSPPAVTTAAGGDELAATRAPNKTLSAAQKMNQMIESEDAIPFIMHGLKYVLHSTDDSEVFVPDYRKKEMYKLVTMDKKYDFQHYAPSVFRCIRNLFGITQQLFYKSLVETGITGGKLGDGKSGMLFFYSNDRRFVLKTVTRAEIFFFKSILRNYLTHVVKNKHTLLPRFFGAFKITLPDQRKLRLVVMNNLFETTCKLDEKYDLKGSTRNRYVDTEKYGRGGVLKDLNFTDAIYLGTTQKRAVMAQLKKDTQFLVEENVMDQSLLIGIHSPGKKVTTDKEYRPVEMTDVNKSLTVRVKGMTDLDSCYQKFKGGLASMVDNPASDHHLSHIYFFGIIDILQEFNAKKRMESTYKCIRYNKKAISAVSSKAYATRFLEYMDQCIK